MPGAVPDGDAPITGVFDLVDDPGEGHHRWDDPDAALKTPLLLQFVQADIPQEPTRGVRSAGS